MSFDDPELTAEFVVEAREHLADIESQLLEIEAGGADLDVELVNTVFRAVHSIKGAAGFLGLVSIKELAHSLEGVLNLMRESTLVPTSPIVDVMLRSADALNGLIEDVENSNDSDVTGLVNELENIASGTSTDPTPPAASPTSPDALPAQAVATTAVENATPTAPPADPAAPGSDASAPQPPAGAANTARKATSGSGESHIRVSVDVLDHLMNLAGELVLGRNQLLQVTSCSDSSLESVAAHINQVTSELQDAIMQTRMQPIGVVFNRFSRVVRDLSNQLGKQCNLELSGQDVEVDKTISEAIGDPLTHLVRNSVDHGIEPPEARVAAGKPAAGTLRLSARHKSGKVSIEISGRRCRNRRATAQRQGSRKGIDLARTGRADDSPRGGPPDLSPGLLTAKAVTDVSGRGVGMDVVRRNIENSAESSRSRLS